MLLSIAIVFALCTSTIVAADAPSPELMNLRGDVTFESAPGVRKPVAAGATTALSANDLAVVGDASLAAITFPDSSAMLVGAMSQIRLSAFAQQADATTATFAVASGEARFRIAPEGSRASYTFTTPSGHSVLVRGGYGEIYQSGTQLRVLCYGLTDSANAIEIDLHNGKQYELTAGQALTVNMAGTVASVAVTAISDAMIAASTAVFGPAPGAASAGHGGSGAGWLIGAAVAAGAVLAVGKKGSSSAAGPSSSGNLTLNPSGPFDFGSPTAAPIALTVTEDGYSGTFSAVAAKPGIVSIASNSQTFTLTPHSAGRTVISVSDANGHTVQVPANVASTNINLTPLGPFNFGSPNGTKAVRAMETGYTGGFTATIVGVSGVAEVSGSAPITVTAVGAGSTTIEVKDSFGNAALANINVASGKLALSPPGPFDFGSTIAAPQGFVASETGYIGRFTATPVDRGIVSITGTSPFTLTPAGAGSTSITVKDSFGNTARLETNVASAQIQLTPAGPFTFGSPGAPAQTFRAHEAGYAGVFSAKPAQTGIVTISGSSPFTISPVAAGSTTIAVTDTFGNTIGTTTTVASGQISVPAALTFTALNQQQSLTPTEAGYTGAFTASIVGAAGIVTIGGSSPSFTVTSAAKGKTSIRVEDSFKNRSIVSVQVEATPAPSPSPACEAEPTMPERDRVPTGKPRSDCAPILRTPVIHVPVARPPESPPLRSHPVGPQPEYTSQPR